ncbi:MAG: hypothetical protein HY952_04395 [Elusimicrobia bacterium]|nr:hypothetical protein [Elusimicrobiota bacterium]
MKNLFKFASAGFVVLGFASLACAGAMDDLGAPQPAAAQAAPVQAVPAEPAQKMPDIDLFGYFGYGKNVKGVELFEAEGSKSAKGVADVVASVDLPPLKNAYLKPAVSFTTGAGTKVFVSGTKAANCPDGGNSCADKEKFFLVLTTAKDQSFFVRAMDIINWGIFMSGSKTITIDGEKYVVKVYANASTPENSKLEVKGPRGVALNSDLKSIGDAVAAKGVDVKLGQSYKLAYGNEIVQGPQGARFTDKMLVLMIPFPVVNASTYYIFNASEITPSGMQFPAFERAYGFKLQGGKLDIYRI